MDDFACIHLNSSVNQAIIFAVSDVRSYIIVFSTVYIIQYIVQDNEWSKNIRMKAYNNSYC